MASSSAASSLSEPLRGEETQPPVNVASDEEHPNPAPPEYTQARYRKFIDNPDDDVWAWNNCWAAKAEEAILIGMSCQWNNPTEIDPVKETFRTKVEISMVFEPHDRLGDENGQARLPHAMLDGISVFDKPHELKRIRKWDPEDQALYKLLRHAKNKSTAPGGQSQVLFDLGLAIPILDLKNTVETPQCINERIDMIPASTDSRRLVTVYLEYQGLFRTTFEMQSYPFDRQLLHVEVGTKIPTTEQVFVPYYVVKPPRASSGIKGVKYVDEYEILGHHLYIKPVLEIEPVLSGKKYGRAFMVLHVQRSPKWALKNIYGIILGFVFSMNTCFALNDIVSRVIVGAVASVCISIYRIAVAAVLPKKRYQTRADWYIFGAVFLTVVLNSLFYVESMCGLLGGENKKRHPFDILLQVVFIFGWLSFHIYYFCAPPALYPEWSHVHIFKEEAVLTAAPAEENPPQAGSLCQGCRAFFSRRLQRCIAFFSRQRSQPDLERGPAGSA